MGMWLLSQLSKANDDPAITFEKTADDPWPKTKLRNHISGRRKSLCYAMDPVTIVGLIGAATSLTFTLGRMITGLHDLKGKYNETNTTLDNILAECGILDTAATLIKEWIEGTPIGLKASLGKLNETLIGFEAVLKPLHQDVSDMLSKAKPSGVLLRRVKLSAIWNETKMKEHLDNVRWRGQAIQLILAATLL
jgi:hypothetical protein